MNNSSVLSTPTVWQETSGSINDTWKVILQVSATTATLFVIFIVAENLVYLYNHFGRGIVFNLGIVLCIYPVFCISSLITIFVPSLVWPAHFISELYLCVVAYLFLLLVTAYWGSFRKGVDKISGKTLPIQGSLPFCVCWRCSWPKLIITPVTADNMILLTRYPMLLRNVLVVLVHVILWIIEYTIPNQIPRVVYISLGSVAFFLTMVTVNCVHILLRTTKLYMDRWNLTPSFLTIMFVLSLSSFHDFLIPIFVEDVGGNQQSSSYEKVLYINILTIMEHFVLSLGVTILFRRSDGKLSKIERNDFKEELMEYLFKNHRDKLWSTMSQCQQTVIPKNILIATFEILILRKLWWRLHKAKLVPESSPFKVLLM